MSDVQTETYQKYLSELTELLQHDPECCLRLAIKLVSREVIACSTVEKACSDAGIQRALTVLNAVHPTIRENPATFMELIRSLQEEQILWSVAARMQRDVASKGSLGNATGNSTAAGQVLMPTSSQTGLRNPAASHPPSCMSPQLGGQSPSQQPSWQPLPPGQIYSRGQPLNNPPSLAPVSQAQGNMSDVFDSYMERLSKTIADPKDLALSFQTWKIIDSNEQGEFTDLSTTQTATQRTVRMLNTVSGRIRSSPQKLYTVVYVLYNCLATKDIAREIARKAGLGDPGQWQPTPGIDPVLVTWVSDGPPLLSTASSTFSPPGPLVNSVPYGNVPGGGLASNVPLGHSQDNYGSGLIQGMPQAWYSQPSMHPSSLAPRDQVPSQQPSFLQSSSGQFYSHKQPVGYPPSPAPGSQAQGSRPTGMHDSKCQALKKLSNVLRHAINADKVNLKFELYVQDLICQETRDTGNADSVVSEIQSGLEADEGVWEGLFAVLQRCNKAAMLRQLEQMLRSELGKEAGRR